MSDFKTLKSEAKTKVIVQMRAFEATVYFKFPETDVFRTKPLSLGSGRVLVCRRPAGLPIKFSKGKATLNFVLDSEVYFMSTTATIEHRQVHFSLDPEVLHLARRKNFRLKIPAGYEATLMIKRVGGQISFLRGSLINVSSDGCRLSLNATTPKIPVGEEVTGSLNIEKFPPIEVRGVVKYSRAKTSGGQKQVLGIVFRMLSSSAVSRIQALVLDLQRELFLKALEE